jgi:uracil-DNA glycosylase
MLNKRRELILEQLGLLPLWVPRERLRAGVEHASPAVDRQPAQTPPRVEAGEERHARILRSGWGELKQMVKTCIDCPLHASRRQTVFGVGDESADWLFVGEGPGAEEDAHGEPFVGQAGRLLDNMLAAIGLKRGDDVYIANILKCRPPGNRVPQPLEVARCEPYLLRQIQLIEPKLIVALGKTAASNLLHTEAAIGSLRGRLHEFRGTPLLVTYHPAYLLRNLADKAKAWEDLCLARDTMTRLKGEARLKAGQHAFN